MLLLDYVAAFIVIFLPAHVAVLIYNLYVIVLRDVPEKTRILMPKFNPSRNLYGGFLTIRLCFLQ